MHDIAIEQAILSKNDEIAGDNRARLRSQGIYAINLISSPGSGKTSLIERTAGLLVGRLGFAVIEGDMETALDADRVRSLGIPAKQITTGRACHLDAHQVSHALPWVFEQDSVRLLIIENVGNMVCPAEYDLGEEMKVAVMSVAEGDDKPLKYPALFSASDTLIINKTDLMPYTDFKMERARSNALRINPSLRIFETSCASGAGLSGWCDFLVGLSGPEA